MRSASPSSGERARACSRAGDLAARAHVTTGAVTGVLNRLERAGYVTRRPDPTDRRRVRVAAVPGAVDRVQAMYAGHHRRLAALLTDHTPDQLAVITDWFTRSTALAHEYLEKLDPDGATREC
ncbi:MarR family transcriptional regulator [Streptomyces sp. NPDC001056]